MLQTELPGWMCFWGDAAPFKTLDPEIEKQALKHHADALQAELERIKQRLGEIDTQTAE